MGAATATDKPVAAFVLSLIGGLLMIGGSGGGMMTGYSGSTTYGGMMAGYYGMMNGFYGAMMGGSWSGWYYTLAAIGLISGVVILIGAIMVYTQPSKASTWGLLIVIFSVLSFFGMGGFFLGAILGVVGGILATMWKGQ